MLVVSGDIMQSNVISCPDILHTVQHCAIHTQPIPHHPTESAVHQAPCVRLWPVWPHSETRLAQTRVGYGTNKMFGKIDSLVACCGFPSSQLENVDGVDVSVQSQYNVSVFNNYISFIFNCCFIAADFLPHTTLHTAIDQPMDCIKHLVRPGQLSKAKQGVFIKVHFIISLSFLQADDQSQVIIQHEEVSSQFCSNSL